MGESMSTLPSPTVLRQPPILGRLASGPSDRWAKCLQCGAFVYFKRLERNLKVCPECNYHFRLSARERIRFLLDADSFQERDADLPPKDPLQFTDSVPYPVRISESQRKSGEKEAAIYGTGLVAGYPVVICALDFQFMGGSMGSVAGEKVTRAVELAEANRVPVIVCSCS